MDYCKLFLLFSFTIINVAIGSVPELSPNTFLFCLKPELEPLEISLNRGRLSVGLPELDDFFQSHKVVKIEPWIKHATEIDRDGDIYLNRIYRSYIDENSLGRADQSIASIQDFPFILYAEPEYIRRPYYTPNDPQYLQGLQCSIEAVKADLAWDYWDIESGEMPGDENILLASVDTGVDYTHPDLIENIWVNQGEIPEWAFKAPEVNSNSDDYVSAMEINNFMLSEGDLNFRDALAGVNVSPFMDGVDNDGNGYVDDLIGWDASGESGTSDNDPFPKQGSGVLNDGGWAHGTHVAGILAAVTNNDVGMASSVFTGKILSVKSARENGEDINDPHIHDGYDGITYAANVGKHAGMRTIINCSWGGPYENIFEQAVITNAYNLGAIIVAAAGNGKDIDNPPDGKPDEKEYAPHFPASYDNVVSVCMVKCSYNAVNIFTYHTSVDLAAPGENIYSTIIGGGYKSLGGSSMASPNAASVMGLLWSYYPEWSNEDVVEQVKLAADPFIYERNPDYIDCNGNEGSYCLGTGMVDAHKAIGRGFSPNIQTGSFTFTEIIGDSDGLINPGETGYLTILLKNALGWADAEYIEAELSTYNSGVIIHDGSAVYDGINSGDSLNNTGDTYKISIAADIDLGDIEFQLKVTGNSIDYNYHQIIEYSTISVSLNQAGFPISTAELRSSPLVIDIDKDGKKEIIIGDYNGLIHIYNADGSEVENDTFPFDTGSQIWGAASAADIDGDGITDFAITTKGSTHPPTLAHLYIFDKNGLKTDYPTNIALVSTPVIGDLVDDYKLEIVFSGYSSDNKIFVINSDGSDVDGFPLALGEKTKAGVALADFNGNGKDDIVVGTDNDNIYLIYDDGSIAPGFPYTTRNKIQAPPSIQEINGEKVIFSGSNDGNFYAVKSDGSLLFSVTTGDKILSSPSFLEHNGQVYIFFGSNDDKIYAVDGEGNARDGWPIAVIGSIVGSVVFSDLDGDGEAEVVATTDKGDMVVFHLDGSNYPYFPINNEVPFSGSPMITDLDGDGDLEILAGSGKNLVVIDLKDRGNSNGYWSEFRGGFERRGSHSLGGCTNSYYCNHNESAIWWDDGSCASDLSIVGGTASGVDCKGECNGVAILDCAGECGGEAMLDICGVCEGTGPEAGLDCDGNPLSLEELLLPITYSIANIYPNPFNPITTIKYGLPDYGTVKIAVYDISGRQVAQLYNNYQSPGFHSVAWEAVSYPSGLYFIRLESNNFNETRKVLLIK